MTAFHLEHRPRNLSQIVGHEVHVTRLRGMIESGKIPNALAFFGPTSAGKTTLARAFAADLNGVENVQGTRDYAEVNASEARTIEDVRNMLTQARMRPTHKKRVIVVDEAQGLLGNAVAANAFLKPLEEPSKDTVWIICSMEPAKFQATQPGRAIANRCAQFVLEPHTNGDLLKQAKRIAKAEKMSYVMDDESKFLKMLVKQCQEMRTVSNTLEALQQYYNGLKEKPKKLDAESISSILKSTDSNDERLAAELLVNLYQLQYTKVHRAVLDTQDGFMFISVLMRLNNFVLNSVVLQGARHPKVWGSAIGKNLLKDVTGKVTVGMLAGVASMLADVKSHALQFQMPVEDLLTANCYRMIKAVAADQKAKK